MARTGSHDNHGNCLGQSRDIHVSGAPISPSRPDRGSNASRSVLAVAVSGLEQVSYLLSVAGQLRLPRIHRCVRWVSGCCSGPHGGGRLPVVNSNGNRSEARPSPDFGRRSRETGITRLNSLQNPFQRRSQSGDAFFVQVHRQGGEPEPERRADAPIDIEDLSGQIDGPVLRDIEEDLIAVCSIG